MTHATHALRHASDTLARRAADEYRAEIRNISGHPLRAELAGHNEADASLFSLFLQDLADLVGAAIHDPEQDMSAHPAALSARRILSHHPQWMRCASDLASSAGLSESSFDALSRWLA